MCSVAANCLWIRAHMPLNRRLILSSPFVRQCSSIWISPQNITPTIIIWGRRRRHRAISAHLLEEDLVSVTNVSTGRGKGTSMIQVIVLSRILQYEWGTHPWEPGYTSLWLCKTFEVVAWCLRTVFTNEKWDAQTPSHNILVFTN